MRSLTIGLGVARRVYEIVRGSAKPVLELSALLLGIVNGLMLLKFYVRDKPKLSVHPVHPEIYQWWFSLPSGPFKGQSTRKYGFIAYVAITNKGLRKVQLGSWRLVVRNCLGRRLELKPTNMPEPSVRIGTHTKLYPVLGQRGLSFDGETTVEAGCSISGMVYYIYQVYGGAGWDPAMDGNTVSATFIVSDAFGKKCKCKLQFRQKTVDEMKTFAPGIESIDEQTFSPNQDAPAGGDYTASE